MINKLYRGRRKFFLFRWFDSMFDWMTAGYSAIVRSLVRKSVFVLVLYAAMSVGAGLFAAGVPVCPSMTPETFCPLRDRAVYL